MGLILNRQRSPITPKALNWSDVKRLRTETPLIYFEWVPNKRTRLVFIRIARFTLDGVPSLLVRYPDGAQDFLNGMDAGLIPLCDGKTWHDSHVVVLPQHVDTLPKEPHWRNRR